MHWSSWWPEYRPQDQWQLLSHTTGTLLLIGREGWITHVQWWTINIWVRWGVVQCSTVQYNILIWISQAVPVMWSCGMCHIRHALTLPHHNNVTLTQKILYIPPSMHFILFSKFNPWFILAESAIFVPRLFLQEINSNFGSVRTSIVKLFPSWGKWKFPRHNKYAIFVLMVGRGAITFHYIPWLLLPIWSHTMLCSIIYSVNIKVSKVSGLVSGKEPYLTHFN